ncbi:hypothetical protein SEA_MEMENTOMORI_83 [Microbacterium phage MementoMori]|uniref:Uncharacterized protein n=1 Tax=Microbacterium phage MementoMori TaxID=2201436 RepID=A0A2Z4Q5I9_9CAUD|nr:hypothetical protein HOT41_gp26 [Microbacterium phage MementoMori]AWY05337.1 hypothetical protein SEA_MEMENTOMORI_83 [Microbacterium phage MementoMori]
MSTCTLNESVQAFESITSPEPIQAYDWHGFIIPAWLHAQMVASGGTSARMAAGMTPLRAALVQ